MHGENYNLYSSTDMIRVVIVMDGGHVDDKCIENRVIIASDSPAHCTHMYSVTLFIIVTADQKS